jgi:hypothetical protein
VKCSFILVIIGACFVKEILQKYLYNHHLSEPLAPMFESIAHRESWEPLLFYTVEIVMRANAESKSDDVEGMKKTLPVSGGNIRKRYV